MLKFSTLATCILLLSSVLFISSAEAERSKGPLVIKSDELQAETKSKTATFTGKVVAKQDDITIFCDRLVVRYAEHGGQVDRVDAFGNVRIVQQNRIGTGQHGTYFSKEGKITLTGNPRVVQGKDMVSGTEITYFVNEEKSVVTGSSKERVMAVIHPKGKEGDDEKKP